MTANTLNDMSRAAVLAAWGVATLVLLFLVLILGYELYNRGEEVAESVSLGAGLVPAAPTVSEPTGVETSIQLYFGSPYSSGLRAETRLVALTDDTVANCKAAFAALAAGPRTEAIPALAATARVRAMYLMPEGDLVVDLARDVDVPGMRSASAEMLMVRSLAMTLSQPVLRAGNTPPIKRVRFLFEGAPTGSHFPEHIKLDFPIEPESTWIVPARSGAGNV